MTPVTEQDIFDAGFVGKDSMKVANKTGLIDARPVAQYFYWPELEAARIDVERRYQSTYIRPNEEPTSIRFLPRIGSLFFPEIKTVTDLEKFRGQVMLEVLCS